jgi:hypothetical protein
MVWGGCLILGGFLSSFSKFFLTLSGVLFTKFYLPYFGYLNQLPSPSTRCLTNNLTYHLNCGGLDVPIIREPGYGRKKSVCFTLYLLNLTLPVPLLLICLGDLISWQHPLSQAKQLYINNFCSIP